jgi:hypothetical protein
VKGKVVKAGEGAYDEDNTCSLRTDEKGSKKQ